MSPVTICGLGSRNGPLPDLRSVSTNNPRRRTALRLVASIEYALTEPEPGRAPAPPWPDDDPLIVCECGHTSLWHAHGTGRCGGLGPYGAPCTCPSLEPCNAD